MAIEPTSLAALDPDQVTQNLDLITQLIQEENPSVEVMRGVFHDLLLYMNSLLNTQLRTSLARYLSARSLLEIQTDPTLADPGVVDDVLSNWQVTRNPGTTAAGEVTIVLSTPVGVTIANGAIFAANGNQYTADAVFTAVVESAQVLSTNTRLLTPLAGGNWAFTITVTAVTVGAASAITRNTLIVPTTVPLDYVTSYATSDFIGGVDAQTNSQLINQLEQGIAAKAPSNRVTMQAMLLAQPQFSQAVRSSIIGFGDPEMLRDQHTIWPGSLGGRVDWYIRTALTLLQTTLTKTATLLSVDSTGNGTWQLSFAKDEAPGFYEVVSVVPPASSNTIGTLAITSDVRSVDTTGPGFIPDIQTAQEGAYTRFQTAVVQFVDTITSNQSSLAVGGTATYSVTVSMMPMLDQIQDFLDGSGVRSIATDVLAKAPMPCFVQIYFRVAKSYNQPDPDIPTLQAAVAQLVNSVDFTGRLYAAQIQDVVGNLLPETMTTGSIDMLGRIRWPDGTNHYIRSNEVLIITSASGTMVSQRTAQFFLNPADVSIAVVTEIPSPVG